MVSRRSAPSRRRRRLAITALAVTIAGVVIVVTRRQSADVDIDPVAIVAPPPQAAILLDLEAWDGAASPLRADAARTVDAALDDFELLAMKIFSVPGREHEIALFRHAATGMEFVLVPAGSFVRRSPTWEEPAWEHAVAVAQPFLLARGAVTWRTWDHVTGESSRDPNAIQTDVSSEDALEFCARSGLELPLSREWEFACCMGRDPGVAYLRSARAESDRRQPFSLDAPDALGLFGMNSPPSVWCRNDLGSNAREGEPLMFARNGIAPRLVHRHAGGYGCADAGLGEPPGLITRFESGDLPIGVRPSRSLRVQSEGP